MGWYLQPPPPPGAYPPHTPPPPDPEAFSFYSEGVFDEPACTTRMRDLDHTVTLFGYGSQDGKDYWLVSAASCVRHDADGEMKMECCCLFLLWALGRVNGAAGAHG